MKSSIADFYKNKRVFVTGHTGFKGGWLAKTLSILGAKVTGYSLDPLSEPGLFSLCKVNIQSVIGDVRNFEKLLKVFKQAKPEVVFHLAAQPIVLKGYEQPRETYETNVMGTVNMLECMRLTDCVQTAVNVTTDKVYRNNEWLWGYRENDILDGYDPYSNSKSCSDMITGCYRNAFFKLRDIPVSTARAGNVIGGGDFAYGRIIPDCVRAAIKGETITLRNPRSVRPYQHVLEPIYAYLVIAEKQYYNKELEGSYNIGPESDGCVTTSELADIFCKQWGKGITWETREHEGNHEASFLKLDNSKTKNVMGCKPLYSIETAVQKTVEWTREYLKQGDVSSCMEHQITEYLLKANN